MATTMTPRRSARLQAKETTIKALSPMRKAPAITKNKLDLDDVDVHAAATGNGTADVNADGESNGSAQTFIDYLVRQVAPTNPDSVASVRLWMIIAICLPLVQLTKTNLQIRATLLILTNITVRLLYPSCYYPASASKGGFIASPIVARCIAFVAEFSLYEVWAVWVGVDFWGPSTYLWAIVLWGECISTTGLLLQSEGLLNIEDSTWTCHAAYMCYLAYMNGCQWEQVAFYGGFAAHMVFSHLPRRFGQMLTEGTTFKMDPLFTGKNLAKIEIKQCNFEERAWVVPMMFGMASSTALMYWQINGVGLQYSEVMMLVLALVVIFSCRKYQVKVDMDSGIDIQ